MYIYKLDDKVNDCSNTYHKTIKMKPVDVKDNPYIDSSKEVDNKGPKFKVGDHERILKQKKTFLLKDTLQISLKKFLELKVKNTILNVINDLIVKNVLEHFIKKNYKKQINKNLG